MNQVTISQLFDQKAETQREAFEKGNKILTSPSKSTIFFFLAKKPLTLAQLLEDDEERHEGKHEEGIFRNFIFLCSSWSLCDLGTTNFFFFFLFFLCNLSQFHK